MKEYKSIFRDMLLCSSSVIILGIHLRFGLDVFCGIAYCIALLVASWRYVDVLGDLGRSNVCALTLFQAPFATYFAIKIFAPPTINPQLQNAPTTCAILIMAGLIHSGYYALRLRDGKVRLDPDAYFKNR